MNKDARNISHDDAEPTVGSAGVVYLPMWIVGLLSLLLYWGCNYVDNRGGDFSELVYEPYRSTNELAACRPGGDTGPNGRVLYESPFGCVACHQSSGAGAPGIAPPLAGSEWVLGPPNRMIRIPLTGLTGPIKVLGNEYNLNMFAVGAALKDEELAAILTYIRSSWGNKASKITPEQVKKVRDELKGRADPQTAEELQKLAE
jgi:mono/diheme cytochrome c family protein